ncbi:ATP-binding response regulator [Halorussus halophilus]|uniref:ATP-binding response regulator n=1 Tax=Halorussus halophilus TaxID=2650975 RepID=UPI001301794F|nr:hybrid sensor histidine kinase/response regulator [Halorussus halophilus]
MDRGSSVTEYRVLYVDDRPELVELAQLYLEREDPRLTVDTAETVEDGLELLEERSYDVVVSDYQMPEMDGLEFLETLRGERNCEIPFIVFTGRGREEVAIEALNLGANRYLQKGGDPSSQYGVLAQAIEQEVEHHRSELARRESERRYESLFENNPIVFWVEDFSEMKAYADQLADDTEDLESYFEEHPDEVKVLLDKVDILDVNENALDYYGAETKQELMENIEQMFTEESYEANKSLMLNVANGETHFRTESVSKTLDGERKHEILEVNVPDAYADDYSRVYLTAMEITDRKATEDREAFLHSLLRHDLRNKQQLVAGYLEEIAEQDLDTETTKRLQMARRELDQCNSIIDNVDTLLRADDFDPCVEDGHERDRLLETVVERHRELAAKNGIEIDRIDGPSVSGGPLLEELFSNLVANAITHSEGTTVEISSRTQNGNVVVTVEDDGVGIPAERRERVLERGEKMGRNAGSGLGLHLVEEIARQHGGHVEVGESDLGGARFDVHVPQ